MGINPTGKRPAGVWLSKSQPVRVYQLKTKAVSQCTHQGNAAFPVFGISKNPSTIKDEKKAT